MKCVDPDFEALVGGSLDPMTSATTEPGGFDSAYLGLFVRAQRSALRILGDRDAAEDVAAETLARAFARWPKISSYAGPWVTRVAVNLALDTLRRKPVLGVDTPPAQEGPVDRLILRDELRRLPRRQREAIVMRYLLELDEQETARMLGVGVATVHTHVKRGLARMRSDFGRLGLGAEER